MTPESNHYQIIAQMALDLKNVQAKLDRLESLVSGSPNFMEGWSDPKEAAAALRNEGVKNDTHLGKLRRRGAFSEVRGEIRNVSQGAGRPTWEYNVPKCRHALKRYFSKLRAV
jgi:hypothetical protein